MMGVSVCCSSFFTSFLSVICSFFSYSDDDYYSLCPSYDRLLRLDERKEKLLMFFMSGFTIFLLSSYFFPIFSAGGDYDEDDVLGRNYGRQEGRERVLKSSSNDVMGCIQHRLNVCCFNRSIFYVRREPGNSRLPFFLYSSPSSLISCSSLAASHHVSSPLLSFFSPL